MICLRRHFGYHFIKYRIYKPIRHIAEAIRYGYWMSEEAQTKSRRAFIMGLKHDMQYKHSKKG